MNDQVSPEGGALPSDANASQASQQPEGVTDKPGSEAESSPAADTSEKAKPKDGESQRIGELTRRWREEQRRSDRLIAMLERERTERAKPAPQPSQDYNGLAQPAQPNQPIDPVEAVKRALAEEKAATERERRSASYRKKAAEFQKEHDDYHEVAGSFPATDEFVELIQELDESPLVAFHLGNNHELAEQIGELSPRRQAIELGRLEAKLVAEREKLKAKPVSKAPPPAPKIEAADPGDLDDTPNSSWSDARYAKWRKKQIAQR